MKKITNLFILITCAVLLLTACSSEYDNYIEEVKTGYLGGCLDVTVGEVFSQTLPDGTWDSGETDSGKIIVEYKSSIEGIETAIQFTVTDKNHFSISGISVDGIIPGSTEEAAQLIESRYTLYYGNKYPDKAAIEFMPNEPSVNIMKGLSASYAEKAKNPVDIADYLDKSKDDIISELGLKEDGGFYKNDEVSIMYDDEESKVFSAVLSESRIYSLFGASPYKDIDENLNKISDRFEAVDVQEGMDNTYSIMLKRNNSNDSLTISYDVTTNSITEIIYMYDALSDYEPEDEYEFEGASWNDIIGGSFSCPDCGGDIFIGVTTDYMQPYIEGVAGDGEFCVYGTLSVINDSCLRYSDEYGEFDIIIVDSDTIVIESDTMAEYAGTYTKYSWTQAG